MKNPYTVEEHEQMLAEGQWTEDGFVEELGLVERESITSQDGDDCGYYGNDDEIDWEWDVSKYTDEHYAGHPKYSGSVLANINGKDCTYLCLGELLSISSVAVSDLYAEWLIHCKNYTNTDADIKISNGLKGKDKVDFLNSILGKFNKTSEIIHGGSSVNGFTRDYLEGKKSGKFIASIDLGSGLYHDVIADGISNTGYLIYHDLQNPSNNTPYSSGMIKNIIQIKDKSYD